MAVKLTVFLFSSISILVFHGCGSEEDSKEVATTEAPTVASVKTTVVPTVATVATVETTAAPAAVENTTSPTPPPTPAPTPDPCSKFMCNCDLDTCEGADVPSECMLNCDDILALPIMVLQGADSCANIEVGYGAAGLCDNCACGAAADASSCPAVIDTDTSMENCEFFLAEPGFGISDCEALEAMFGGVPVCSGCDCPEPASDGYGYGYAVGRSLNEEEKDVTSVHIVPHLKLSPEGVRLLAQGQFRVSK
jgi:hypothetical protein